MYTIENQDARKVRLVMRKLPDGPTLEVLHTNGMWYPILCLTHKGVLAMYDINNEKLQDCGIQLETHHLNKNSDVIQTRIA